ncbi:MAG: hypothetical protein V4516_03230 [Pseudomonadota bacterium]
MHGTLGGQGLILSAAGADHMEMIPFSDADVLMQRKSLGMAQAKGGYSTAPNARLAGPESVILILLNC